MKRLKSLALSVLIVGACAGTASAAIFNISLSAGGHTSCAPSEWLTVTATLYRNRRTAGFRHIHDHRYQWYAFRSSEWKRFVKRGYTAPAPTPVGRWARANSKYEIRNAWCAPTAGRYTLVCSTSKTFWQGAGVLDIHAENRVRRAPPPRPRARPRPRVTRVVLNPARCSLKVGESVNIAATVYDQFNNTCAGVPLRYSAAGGGHMSGSRFIAGRKPGTFDVWVVHDPTGKAAVVKVTIIQPVVCNRIIVTPTRVSLFPGEQVALRAVAYDQYNRAMTCGFSYDCSGGGRIAGNRFVAGSQPGTYQVWVRAAAFGISQVVNVTVRQRNQLTHLVFREPVKRVRAGQRVLLELLGFDQENRPMTLSPASCRWDCRTGTISRGSFWSHRTGMHKVVVYDSASGKSATAWIYVHR